jgi:multidrug resistance efflux pump
MVLYIMKQKIQKILSSPKLAIGATIVIALIIGTASYISNKNARVERFTKVGEMSQEITSKKGASAPQDLTLAFPVGGRIKDVYVKIGDTVQAGTVLASLDTENAIGAINQAKAAYAVAQTAYNKLQNGASSPDIGVSQAAVDTAATALGNAQQNLVRDISLAYNNVNSTILTNTNSLFSNPQSDSPKFGVVGLVQSNSQLVTNINSERLEINGDLVKWQNEVSGMGQSNVDRAVTDSLAYMTKIRKHLTDILNVLTTYTQISASGTQATLTTSQNYITSAKVVVDAAYNSITNDLQAIKSAKAAFDQANASLALKQSPARSEDLEIAKAQVDSTQGALQIAQGTYNNMIITAPVSGKIINVSITAGQVATPNTAAIEILSK